MDRHVFETEMKLHNRLENNGLSFVMRSPMTRKRLSNLTINNFFLNQLTLQL